MFEQHFCCTEGVLWAAGPCLPPADSTRAAGAHQTGNMNLLWIERQRGRAPRRCQATVGLLCQIQVALVNTGALTYCHCA